MKCDFCGSSFDEQSASDGCRTCAIFGGCKKVKCPHCNYETPVEPGLVKWLRKKVAKR